MPNFSTSARLVHRFFVTHGAPSAKLSNQLTRDQKLRNITSEAKPFAFSDLEFLFYSQRFLVMASPLSQKSKEPLLY